MSNTQKILITLAYFGGLLLFCIVWGWGVVPELPQTITRMITAMAGGGVIGYIYGKLLPLHDFICDEEGCDY